MSAYYRLIATIGDDPELWDLIETHPTFSGIGYILDLDLSNGNWTLEVDDCFSYQTITDLDAFLDSDELLALASPAFRAHTRYEDGEMCVGYHGRDEKACDKLEQEDLEDALYQAQMNLENFLVRTKQKQI